jgi:hypothetical protein
MDADKERARRLAAVEIPMKVVSSRNVSAAGDCMYRLFVRTGWPGELNQLLTWPLRFLPFFVSKWILTNLKLNFLGFLMQSSGRFSREITHQVIGVTVFNANFPTVIKRQEALATPTL